MKTLFLGNNQGYYIYMPGKVEVISYRVILLAISIPRYRKVMTFYFPKRYKVYLSQFFTSVSFLRTPSISFSKVRVPRLFWDLPLNGYYSNVNHKTHQQLKEMLIKKKKRCLKWYQPHHFWKNRISCLGDITGSFYSKNVWKIFFFFHSTFIFSVHIIHP